MGQATEVLIVGGGVIGCSVAHYLTEAGARVTLLERRQIAEEASWATAGIISGQHAPENPVERVRLEMRSFNLFPALIAELQAFTGLSVDHHPSGELVIAFDADQAAALRAMLPWQREIGLTVEWLDGDEVRRREPALSPGIVGAVACPEVGSVRGDRLTRALARAARLRGATILEQTPVERLLTDGERVVGVRTPRGDFRADTIVLAAGAWTGGIGAALGLPLPTRPVHGQMLALDGTNPPLRRIVAGAGGYLLPRADGTVAVAATVEEGGFERRVTPAGLAWLASLIRTVAPPYAEARVIATWSGLRPASPDGLPIMGRVPGQDRLWVATGHFRNGILWAPVTGELLTASILAGRPDPALATFAPARFA